MPNCNIERAEALSWVSALPEKSVDLFFFSPFYEDCRLYLENGVDLGIALKTDAWVEYMIKLTKECLRACKGLVAFVVEGKTKKFKYSCGPVLLMADLHRAGVCLRKPPVFHRRGIPGSGGPDWLRNDYEFIVCCTNGGKLPWSANTSMGHIPKYGPGGEMSYRTKGGNRVNSPSVNESCHSELIDGRAGHKPGKRQGVFRTRFSHNKDGSVKGAHDRHIAAVANPGNVLHYPVGGGLMGSKLAHENEAPFPLKLAEFFVRSFCPPDGLVCDPMLGSGTTAHAAILHGRRFQGCDIRQSQVDLSNRRMADIRPLSQEAPRVPTDRTLEQPADSSVVDLSRDLQ